MDPSASGWQLRDSHGIEYQAVVLNAEIEAVGPLRTTFRLSGIFTRGHDAPLCEFDTWVSFFAQNATVRIEMTLRNPRRAQHRDNLWDLGDPGSIFVRDFSLRVTAPNSGPRRVCWSAEALADIHTSQDGDLEIYQDSSGGENWDSPIHVNRENRIPNSFRGYRVNTSDCDLTGERSQPVVTLYFGASGVGVAVRHFWQNFPKAVEVKGHSLITRLFPQQYADVHELQGGEQKTHTLYLAFLTDKDTPDTLAWSRTPLVPHSSPEWYAQSEAIPYLVPKNQDSNKDYLALVDAAIEGNDTFVAKREFVDAYGWRNFGDLYADHEAIYYSGPKPVVSHYNNQYDAIYGAIIQFLRSGDTRWFHISDDLAAHLVDIDIYHTTVDKTAYNGGLFWHTNHYVSAHTSSHRSYSRHNGSNGGGPCNEHCYTTGLLYHYLITGTTRSRQAVLDLAHWVINSDDGTTTIFRWLDRSYTGAASSTANRSYHGPGRGGGNAINALLDAFVLTRNPHFLAKAEQLVRRCIHPRDDIASRTLLDAERRWSYTVFLQTLGRYLDLKSDMDQLDSTYAYARASLLHYAQWMAEHEVPYLAHPERLEYPTETWSAQDMRKTDVFNYAAKLSTGPTLDRFLERADFFFRSSVRELMSSTTRSLTRPTVILMSSGYMHAYVQSHRELSTPEASCHPDFGTPQRFLPQKTRALRKVVLTMLGLAIVGMFLVHRFSLPF